MLTNVMSPEAGSATTTLKLQPLSGPPVIAAIVAGMVAMSVANILPVMVGILADRMSLDSGQAGLVASADIGGLAVGSLICTFLRHFSLRTLGCAGLSVLALTNFATIFVHGFIPLVLARFCGGAAGGFALAVCYAVLGSGDQARDFAIFNVGQIAIGWIGMLFIPSLLAGFGWQGIFFVLAILAVAAASLAVLLPHRIPHPNQGALGEKTQWPGGALMGILTVGSVVVYFSGQGGVWAYLDRMGAVRGFAIDSVTVALAWSMFGGMVASMLAIWLDIKLGILMPLLAGFAIATVGLLQLWFLPSMPSYLLATIVFVFGWNVIVPYQFAAVAKVDGDGMLAMLASTASVAGLALGPALVSPLAQHGAYGQVRIIALAMNAASLLMLLPAIRYRSKKAV